MNLDLLDFTPPPLDLGLEPDDSQEDHEPPSSRCPGCKGEGGQARALKRETRHVYRRAFSETRLLDLLERDFTPGASYHVISGGDIDSLSYLKHVLRQQPLDYCLFSTWCMASEDVAQFSGWIDEGKIGRLDAYCGEIFPGSYRKQHAELKEVILRNGGRLAIFQNHSKIYAGVGPRFAFAIESSANINTNPRTENSAIHVGDDVFLFYKAFFDGVKSYARDFDEWKPWEP